MYILPSISCIHYYFIYPSTANKIPLRPIQHGESLTSDPRFCAALQFLSPIFAS